MLFAMLPDRSRRRIPVVAIIGLVVSALEGVGVGLIIPLLAFLWSNSSFAVGELSPLLQPVARWALSFEPSVRIPVVSIAILTLVAIKVVIASVNQQIIARSAAQLGGELRERIADRLLTASFSFISSTERARLLHVFSIDSYRIADGCYHLFQMVAYSASTIVLGLFLFLIDWRLFAVVLCGALFVRYFGNLYSNKIKKKSESLTEQDIDLYHEMLQVVSAYRIFRLFGAEEAARKRFRAVSHQVRDTLFSMRVMAARAGQALEFLQASSLIILLLIGFALDVRLPVMAAFLVLLLRVQPYLLTIVRASVEFASLKGPIKGVEWLLRDDPSRRSPTGRISIARISGDICLDNVSFSYGEERPVLQGVCAIVGDREVTAILGPSGSGKSTLVNLICRLIEPTAGRIRAGNIDIATIEPASWRRHIGLAGQDVDLIDGTILQNIALGAADADQSVIEAASRTADAHSFILEFPQGYETQVGHRGMSLSGGQRQRIGLARALVRKPSLLILDEALSAVDGVSEESLLTLLSKREWFRSAILISHRPTTIAACDSALVLDNGGIAEAGRLQSLRYFKSMNRRDPRPTVVFD